MKKLTGRPNTIRTKESLFRNWVAPFLADDGSDLDEVIATWEADLQPATVKSLLYIAQEHVRDASGVELDITPHISRIGRSKQQLPPKALARTELAALTEAIPKKSPLYLPFHIAINTGMRRGEVMGLKWEDVDMLRNQLWVSRSYDGPTKSGKSRVIPISSALEKVLVAQTFGKSYNSARKKRTGNVVPSNFDPNPPLKLACREAGIRNITFHALRHTFATLALEAGRSPVLVSKVLGHARTSTTIDLYWASSGERLDLGFLDE